MRDKKQGSGIKKTRIKDKNQGSRMKNQWSRLHAPDICIFNDSRWAEMAQWGQFNAYFCSASIQEKWSQIIEPESVLPMAIVLNQWCCARCARVGITHVPHPKWGLPTPLNSGSDLKLSFGRVPSLWLVAIKPLSGNRFWSSSSFSTKYQTPNQRFSLVGCFGAKIISGWICWNSYNLLFQPLHRLSIEL